jgi:hypothetical protein
MVWFEVWCLGSWRELNYAPHKPIPTVTERSVPRPSIPQTSREYRRDRADVFWKFQVAVKPPARRTVPRTCCGLGDSSGER